MSRAHLDFDSHHGTYLTNFKRAPAGPTVALVRVRKTPQDTTCSIEIYAPPGRRTLRSPSCNPNNVDIDWTPHGSLLVGYGAGTSVSGKWLYGADGRELWSSVDIGHSTSPSRRYVAVLRSTRRSTQPDHLDVVDLGTRHIIKRLPLGEQSWLQWNGSSLTVKSSLGKRVLKLERAGVGQVEQLT